MFRNVHISKMLTHTSAFKCHMCNMVCTWGLFRSYCFTTCITWPPPCVLFGGSSRQQLVRKAQAQYIISYPLFADVDTGIYPRAALQYHARPQAKRGIAIPIVDKFQYPRQQTRAYWFIPCANDVCYILKRFTALSSQLFHLSGLNHCINEVLFGRITVAKGGWWSWSQLWRHQWRYFSLYLTLMTWNARYV